MLATALVATSVLAAAQQPRERIEAQFAFLFFGAVAGEAVLFEDRTDGTAVDRLGGVGLGDGLFADSESFSDGRRERLGEVILAVRERAALVRGPAEGAEAGGERERVEGAGAAARQPREGGADGDGDAAPEVIFQRGALVAVGAHEREAGEDRSDGAEEAEIENGAGGFAEGGAAAAEKIEDGDDEQKRDGKVNEKRMQPAEEVQGAAVGDAVGREGKGRGDGRERERGGDGEAREELGR